MIKIRMSSVLNKHFLEKNKLEMKLMTLSNVANLFNDLNVKNVFRMLNKHRMIFKLNVHNK